MEERQYYLGFSLFSGIGPAKFGKLIQRFGSAEQAWNALEKDLAEVLGDALFGKFETFRNTFLVQEYEQKLKEKKVSYITAIESGYPKSLLEIQRPPIALFCKGDTKILKPAESEARLWRQVRDDRERSLVFYLINIFQLKSLRIF